MKKNKIFKDSRPLEMLDYLDEAYVAEVVDNLNPTAPTKKIIIRNQNEGVNFILPDKEEFPFFKDTEIVIE